MKIIRRFILIYIDGDTFNIEKSIPNRILPINAVVLVVQFI